MSHIIYLRFPVLVAALVGFCLLALAPAALSQSVSSVELVGVIQQMALNAITVNQQYIDIRSAVINAPLQVGAVVKVEGSWDDAGTIVARQVRPVTGGIQPGEAEMIGVLESFTGTVMVVSGQVVDAAAAEIKPGVVVGQPVRAHVTAVNANTWRAREVDAFQARDDDSDDSTPAQTPADDELEITGTLESIGGREVVVAGQTISFSGAEIKDPLVLGVLVKLHVQVVDGQLVAREIENADTRDDDDDAGDNNSNANANTNQNRNSNDNASGGSANQNRNTNDNNNQNDDDNDQSTLTAAVSAQQAVDTALQVYPTTPIRSVKLTTKFGGTLVWEVRLANRVRLYIDAASGAILVIDRPGVDDNQNANGSMNGNDNDDDDDRSGNFNSNLNSNTNDNSGGLGANFNGNQNQNHNTNDNDDDDDDDDDD